MHRLTIRIDRVLGTGLSRAATREEKTTPDLVLVISSMNSLEAVNKAIRLLTSEQGDMMANQNKEITSPSDDDADDDEEEDL